MMSFAVSSALAPGSLVIDSVSLGGHRFETPAPSPAGNRGSDTTGGVGEGWRKTRLSSVSLPCPPERLISHKESEQYKASLIL